MSRLLDIIRGLSQFKQPDIIHFIGHGATLMCNAVSKEQCSMPLLFTRNISDSASGSVTHVPELYNSKCISAMLNQSINVDGKPRLVILQACETATFARELVSKCPKLIVLSWVTRVLDAACHIFSKKFYETLFALLQRKRILMVCDIVDAFASTRIWLQKDVSVEEKGKMLKPPTDSLKI